MRTPQGWQAAHASQVRGLPRTHWAVTPFYCPNSAKTRRNAPCHRYRDRAGNRFTMRQERPPGSKPLLLCKPEVTGSIPVRSIAIHAGSRRFGDTRLARKWHKRFVALPITETLRRVTSGSRPRISSRGKARCAAPARRRRRTRISQRGQARDPGARSQKAAQSGKQPSDSRFNSENCGLGGQEQRGRAAVGSGGGGAGTYRPWTSRCGDPAGP